MRSTAAIFLKIVANMVVDVLYPARSYNNKIISSEGRQKLNFGECLNFDYIGLLEEEWGLAETTVEYPRFPYNQIWKTSNLQKCSEQFKNNQS